MPDNIYPITITATETHGIDRNAIPYRIGIPFPKGVLLDVNELRLLNHKQQAQPFQHKVLAHWPDNSIRWLLVDFKLTVDKNNQTTYQLRPDNAKSGHTQPIRLKQHPNRIHIDNNAISFDMNRIQFLDLSNISIKGYPHPIVKTDLYLIDDQNNKHPAQIENLELSGRVDTIRSEIRASGHFGDKKNHNFFRFESTITVFSDSPIIELEITLHNPNAARHKGGFWDLGDPGSLFFKSLIFECDFGNIEKTDLNNLETGTNQQISGNFRLYQDSSGGKNWEHGIHIDRDGKSSVTFKGYQTTLNKRVIESGERASPLIVVHCKNDKPATSVYIRQFWQNFPKAFSTDGGTLKIELFPETPKSPYELQGGEQKNHSVRLTLNNDTHPLLPLISPINVTLPVRHYCLSNALPGLLQEPTYSPLDKIINEGIEGDNNFFKKRENADEYGWRHFGDIWADHETLEHGNDRSIVSHYNNQYDAILGFLTQYLYTGKDRWKELLDDLVHHVVDIDIYHTDLDRLEYNQGLFWHTDHYLDGRYCTHRSFSKRHMEIAHVEQSGGGPGPEHCYTSGLLFYYFISGEERIKNAFLSLSQWADYANLGTGGVLERIFEFARKDVKKLKLILNSEYVFNFRFPLSRGTGNYINTLLDNYLLTQNHSMIEKAAWVIKNTISPKDRIVDRQLMEDIEGHWHYTILLQSISRFLNIKESEKIIDDGYLYALSSFSLYAEFVMETEKPYLKNSDILVYPNVTWIAQDLRKAQILNSYSAYCNEDKHSDVCRKRDEFLLYVTRELSNSSQRNYSRILIILAQNHFGPNASSEAPKCQNLEPAKIRGEVEKSTELTVISLIKNVANDIFQRLLKLNIRREINWLNFKLRG